jgi:hypothetical protein
VNASATAAVMLFRLLVAGFLPRQAEFDPGSNHMASVVDKAALGQVFSEYFGFPCQSFFLPTAPQCTIYHPGLVQQANEWPQKQQANKQINKTKQNKLRGL